MSFRRPLLTLATVLAVALPVLPAAAAETKVGFVDLQRVMMESEDGKAAKQRLQDWMSARQKEIETQQEALRKEQETLQKQASAMSDETRTQKATELQRKVMELGQRFEKTQREAAERERREMGPIMDKVEQAVGKVAEREGLSLVLERRDSGLVWAQPSLDITNEVMRAYAALPRAKAPAAAPKPAAAPAPKK